MYEGSKDQQTVPLFSVHYQNRYSTFDLIGSEAYLGYSGQYFNLGVAANYDFGRQAIATGKGRIGVLSQLDAQFEPGLFIDFKLPVPGFSSEDRVELQNRFLARGGAWHMQHTLSTFVRLASCLRNEMEFDFEYANGKHFNRYFGVSMDESLRSGLDPYHPTGTHGRSLAINHKLIFSFAQHWGLASNLIYTRLLDTIGDRPILIEHGQQNQFSYGISSFYRW